MDDNWFEDEVRLAQERVQGEIPKDGTPPFPVYRPSKKEVIWVPDIDAVIFVAMVEEFQTKAAQIIKDDEEVMKLGLIRRLLYKGRGK